MHQLPNNDFDQFIIGKLENASVEAPAFLWNRIEEKLPPVTPWYSKYKYLLLLLSLSLSTSGGIYLYNQTIAGKSSNTMALNKRLLKDELSTNSSNSITKKSEEDNSTASTENQKVNSTTSQYNKSANTTDNNKSVVSSFYTATSDSVSSTNQSAIQKADEFKKREQRLSRFEVKNNSSAVNTVNTSVANVNSDKKAKSINSSKFTNNTSTANNIIVSKKKKSKKYYGSDIPTVQDEIFASKSANTDINNNTTYNTENSITANVSTENQSKENNFDITQPIVEPLQNTSTLTASATPVKVELSPVSSREALRALIEKDKLETFDMTNQAAGVADLNPNREKMLKNLKQFSGYSIHKGFHIGAFIAINNVWLNKKQFSSDENTTSIKPKVQFGKAYGINIGYDFTDRLGVMLEWQMSEQGQKYNVGLLADNNKHTKDVSLLYTKFPMLFKYKQTFINHYNSKPIAVSFVVGPQIGVLIKQNVTLDGVKVSNAPQYNKVEAGVLGGFDFDLYMMRYMYLTIGARTGFASSFQKNQPMSFQLGITTQLNFRYAKKIK